jgi:hypothetical protein
MYMIILNVKVLDLTTGDVGDVDEHIVMFHMNKIVQPRLRWSNTSNTKQGGFTCNVFFGVSCTIII